MNIIKTIFLTRHGSTPYNDTDLLQGVTDNPLSEKGTRESEQLAEYLKTIPIDAIFCSPLRRVHQTAGIVNTYHNAPVTTVDSFIEMNMGSWEGLPFHKTIEQYPEIYKNWVRNPQSTLPAGESFLQVFNRVKAGIDMVLNSSYFNVLVVAHAIVNRAILGNLTGMDVNACLHFRTGNCAISKLEVFESDGETHVVVDSWNNKNHLI